MSALPNRVPSITMDRAVGQYYESVDIDFVALQEYYDSLDMADKPLLEDCHIHFSSLGRMDGGSSIEGGYSQEKPKKQKYLGESVPEHHIVAFLGSTLILKDYLPTSEHPFTDSTVLAHELVHYAQDEGKGFFEILRDIRAMRKIEKTSEQRSRSSGLTDFTVGATAGFLLGMEATSNTVIALASGIATGGLLQQYNRKYGEKRRQRKHEKALEKYDKTYRGREHEEEAREHQETELELVTTVPRAKKDRPVVLNYDMHGSAQENKAAIKWHEDACYGKSLPLAEKE